MPPEGLQFWNGYGGFARDGREYVILIDGTAPGGPALPPAPWTNVLANPGFGCLVTEAGLGYSWAGNSQLNRLTPWSNDPVSDPPGEAVYLRDEDTGAVWTPTPLPRGAGAAVIVRHGQGYTRYSRRSHGLEQELLVLVPPDDPVKLVCLRVRNAGDRPRRLSATFYAEWVLGSVRENAPLQVVCERDVESGAVLARNAWAGDFAGLLAFAAVGSRPHSATADRAEFLGRHGSPAAPAALGCAGLSGRAEPALDPCAALSTPILLAPGQTEEVVFVLGQADSLAQVRHLTASYTVPGRAEEALQEVQRLWDRILGAVQVTTPDAGLDLMVNRWLPYQVLACRVWGRTAFYQSGGAYGFRDQLQDVMALVYSFPEEARTQILRSAGRQFEEGDVQHWWHPPSGRGVRTRITDDLYFLPLVVHHYVTVTGETALLDEQVPFLKSPVLRPDQEDDYNLPGVTEQGWTVYEHCIRALEHGYKLGAHGLPLMGTGDWNDGMNRVGAQGKGESVWNGWFFITVLKAFAELAGRRGDAARAAWCRERAEGLRAALEANAWDGAWYRRAYFDDGTPLGSAQNDECQIDAIPQAWAVISGAADPARAEQAMASVEERLVHLDSKLIQLFDPPFDRGSTAARLHQGLRAGDSRERRPVHPRGHLGRSGDGTARPRRSCAGAVEPDQPGLPRHHARGGAALQGRALRGLRRHLWRSAAHRPRRLDLVHWLGGLAVPRRPGSDPRYPSVRRHAPSRALHPERLAGIRGRLPSRVRDVPNPGGEPGRHRPRRAVGPGGRAAGAGRRRAVARRRARA